ncbi:MAG TPA: chemotaxis protein CheD [Sulfuricella sp.]|nr:chemotaxis protein CheD [Sulfuricella sp.]
MLKTDQVIEIFLQPGEHFFGDRQTRIRTVLGSCVSLVFWHPHQLVGGMCHYMLPGRAHGAAVGLDGRYADEAVALMLEEVRASGTQLHEYQVKMFGGGNMFPTISRMDGNHVGMKNVLAARELMRKHGFDCVSEHVEGSGHRNLIFDVWSGHVAMKHLPLGQSGAAKADAISINPVARRNVPVSSSSLSPQFTHSAPGNAPVLDPLKMPGAAFRKQAVVRNQ